MQDIKAYILSIFTTALLITVVDVLAPTDAGSGLSKHLKLVTSLMFLCVLISPTISLAERLMEFANGNWNFEIEGDMGHDYSEELQSALDGASQQYFTEMLIETLCKEFEIMTDDVRAHVEWSGKGENLRPQKVTVVLSGKAIWKDPAKIEAFVTALLECECVTAIE